MAVELTSEQQEFLAQCEADFADRYTENDPEYAKVLKQSTPPILFPWSNHARRNYDWSEHRRDNGGRDRWRGKHSRRDDRHHNRHQPYHRYR